MPAEKRRRSAEDFFFLFSDEPFSAPEKPLQRFAIPFPPLRGCSSEKRKKCARARGVRSRARITSLGVLMKSSSFSCCSACSGAGLVVGGAVCSACGGRGRVGSSATVHSCTCSGCRGVFGFSCAEVAARHAALRASLRPSPAWLPGGWLTEQAESDAPGLFPGTRNWG